MKNLYRIDVEYPAEYFFSKLGFEEVIDAELKKAKLPEVDSSGCGFGVRDLTIYGLKTMQHVYAAKRIIRKVFKNRRIKGYKIQHFNWNV